MDRFAIRHAFAGLAVCLLLNGCAGRPNGGLIPVAGTAPGASTVDLFVATTRKPSDAPGQVFTGERDRAFNFADISVSIPPDSARKIGDVQMSSADIGDPSRDFVALRVDKLDRQEALRRFNARVARTPGRQVLVFVHGYNTRFGEAVFRLAQIVHDSGITAAPILFTWPSRGELLGYTYDRESANYSRDALELLLQGLQKDPAVGEIDVLAHSMGNWVTLEALRQMAIRDKRLAPKIKNVMLASPDVDVDVFRRQFSELGADHPPFTIFVSRDDEALAASQKVWGDRPRLGAVDPEQEPYKSMFQADRITVIDLTAVKTGDALHHTKFAESPVVVQSIGARLAAGQNFNDGKAGLGDKITRVTTGVASTIGSTAGLVISAPIAIVDGRTRDGLEEQFHAAHTNAESSLGAISNVGDLNHY
jgi:esterase/lipase superfamily enzyme